MIVESPAKARTLERYLGKRHYSVQASLGHIRDLPKSDLGVDVEQDFAPKYVIPRDKSKTVTELARAARQASGVYLATDPDREGEAIAWHLLAAINKRGGAKARAAGPVEAQRIVFHEVTKSAVQDAFRHARDIDDDLVQAQQARRVMDRLIGYKLSPLLGAKVRRGLSAGRVQSPALRMVVEREREIEQFVSEEYWTIEALLAPASANGTQETVGCFLGGVIQHRGEKLSIATEAHAQATVNALRGMSFAVQDVRKREQRRQPAAPFTTSTLQQEAGRRLRFAPRRTMRVAQQLYEGLDVGQGRSRWDSSPTCVPTRPTSLPRPWRRRGRSSASNSGRNSCRQAAAFPHQSQGRAGSPRGHPADFGRAPARSGAYSSHPRSVSALHAHLEALCGQPDGRRSPRYDAH